MNKLDAFCVLREAAQKSGGGVYKERALSGEALLTVETIQALIVLGDSGELPELRVNGQHCAYKQLPSAGKAAFIARAPKAYFETLSELIERHPIAPPEGFRVFQADKERKKIALYEQTSRLADLLIKLSAKHDYSSCVLFAKDKLELKFKYAVSNLRLLEGIDELSLLLQEEPALTAKDFRILDVYQTLFKQALYDVLAGVATEARFATLLDKFSECLFRLRLAFKQFEDEANTAIERYEETRTAMISALNGVLGNIQTSLIGVPLAGFLALKEIKAGVGWAYETTIIVIGVVTVGSLLLALSFSQGKTLQAIKDQFQNLKQEIEAAGGAKTRIGTALTSMESHHCFVSRLLWVVRFIIMAFILVAVIAPSMR